jgi:hypothetical protein
MIIKAPIKVSILTDIKPELLRNIKDRCNKNILTGSCDTIALIEHVDKWVVVHIEARDGISQRAQDTQRAYFTGLVSGILAWEGVEVV